MGANPGKYPRRTLACLLLIMGSLLAACGSGSSEPADTATPEEESSSSPAASTDEADSGSANSVTMKLIAFKPGELEVAAGSEVTWTQTDAGFHTVTSGTVEQGGSGVTRSPDGKFSSEMLATDKTFSFKFDQPGTYPYYCDIHPATMRGEVTVKG